MSASGRAHHVSDWIGFAIFSLWAAVTLSKMPAVGIFVAPSFLIELFVAVAFLTRDQPTLRIGGMRPRLAAYGGSFVFLGFLQFGNRFHPEWFAPGPVALPTTGVALWLTGSAWIVYSIWHLRSAFSIEPAARRLITTGPYRVARHPIYAGYLLQYAGTLLTFPSVPCAGALLVWFLLMADRMRLEETVLLEAFPDYADYRRRVGALASFPRRRPARTPEPAITA